MEVLSIIPARGGSKGIKRKNLKLILDKPLIAYSIEDSLNSKYITKTILSSEDDEILEAGKKYGAQIVKRPDELAIDTAKTAPVILDVLDKLEKENYIPDYVILLQPTCPIREDDYIDKAFEFFLENEKKGYDSCFGAFDLGYTHAKWKIGHGQKFECLYDYHLRPRRQELDEHFQMIQENGAFYALKRETMLKTKDFLGDNPIAYITDRIIDIDTIDDFKKVEDYLCSKK